MSTNDRTETDNPYPGLRPFTTADAHLYFGRERQIDAMLDLLASAGLLAVLGGSGSGKSSLVNCGLQAALHMGRMGQAGTDWRVAQMRPGSDPIGNLARALAQALATDGSAGAASPAQGLLTAEMLEADLRASSLGLVDVYRQALAGGPTNLLVVVDQLEELFRYRNLTNDWQDDAAAFIRLLLEARQRPGCAIHLVLTLRSDFLGACDQFHGLAEAIAAGIFLLPRLSRSERRSAISGPAAVAGVTLSPVLLNRLVNDTDDATEQLPLLQHALNRMWAHRRHAAAVGGVLELVDYEAVGTSTMALDKHAEQLFAHVPPGQAQQWCARVFKSLIDRVLDPRGVRRPTRFDALCQIVGAHDAAAADAVAAAIAPFRAPECGFLLPPLQQPLQPDTVLDLSHESLLRGWRRLERWVDEEAQSARFYQRLADTADLHAAAQAALLRDPDLQQALDWRAHQQPTPAWGARWQPGFERAMQFLDHSKAERDMEAAQREMEAAQREMQQQRASRSRLRGTPAVLLLAALAVGGLLGYLLGDLLRLWGRG